MLRTEGGRKTSVPFTTLVPVTIVAVEAIEMDVEVTVTLSMVDVLELVEFVVTS